jgi:hypothetical protein
MSGMSCYLSFNLNLPIICKTVKYIGQSDNSSWHELVIDTYRFSSLIPDWLVENMNPDMTPNSILLDISALPKNTFF